jgi:hypothetical protein
MLPDPAGYNARIQAPPVRNPEMASLHDEPDPDYS